MKNMKFWRTALVATLVLTVMLSVTGGTIAWFTDEVTSSENKIQAGTLDIELWQLKKAENATEAKWVDISKSTKALFDNSLWEPGYVEYKVLKVKNVGTLALKWNAQILSDVALNKLADVIDVYTKVGVTELPANRTDINPINGWTKEATLAEFIANAQTKTVGKLEAEQEATLGIALKMREEAGNEYQGLSLGNIDIRIEATQATFEEDSFNDQYDANAPFVDVSNVEDLKAALANGGNIKLTADITGGSEILEINKPTVIDGNGKKLTSSAGRAINVSGANGVTIKNLTVEASGERAINVIQKATNVVIENVTATASNYTVNVASSAPNAVVTIKNSTLDGLNTVNVASAGAVVTVQNSTINCNDNNTTAGEVYAALCLNKDAMGGKIIATGSTINVTEGSGSEKGRNGAEDGTVTIDGSTDGVTVTVAAITYEGSDYYYGFTTLADAIEFAKSGDTITLIRDIEHDADTTITVPADKSITLDLNGKTLSGVSTETGANRSLITVKGDLTVKNGTMTVKHKGANMEWSNLSAVFSVEGGKLTLGEDVVVENLGGSDMAYGVDVNTTLGKTILNINGATIKSPYIAVRIFNNHKTEKGTVNLNNGVVEGVRGDIWAQLMSAPAENAVVNSAYSYTQEAASGVIYHIAY